jgi:hypothetical protein
VDREKALECVEGELDAEGGGFFQDRAFHLCAA